MDNNALKYLLSDNVSKCVNKSGVIIRKIINPLFRNFMMIFTSAKLVIINKNNVSKKENVIYAGTHGFHDDIIFTIKTANRHAYLLYGNLLDFFKTFHGFGLWVNGVILVDRGNKESRKNAVYKMEQAIKNGTNIVMFPEGTWNKNESLIVQKLHLGIYDVAKETGARVVPIATCLDGKIAYSKQGEAFDITYIDDENMKTILINDIKLIKKCLDLLIYNGDMECYIKNKLIMMFNKTKDSLDISLIDNISSLAFELGEEVNSYKDSLDKNSIEFSTMDRITTILKLIERQKKIVMVSVLRDKMATLKWDLYKNANRTDFDENYWESYVDNLISTTNGMYNYEEEDAAEYKNPLDECEKQVFSILDNIEITNKNAKVLVLTKNR